MKEPDLSLAGWMLLEQATSLRTRAFARSVAGLHDRSIEFVHCKETFEIYPASPSVEAILHSCAAHSGAREALAAIPIARPPRSVRADPELVPMLQDLAEIVSREATDAFTADYYPGLADVFVPEEHVTQVMVALQREMDREGKSRQKVPVSFATLPPERQRALAERRRWWYRKFSITPERWLSGLWSLWEVSEEPMPEYSGHVLRLAAVR
jgi:hypothetical protein